MIYKKDYTAPPLNVREIWRYAGCGTPTKELCDLLEECTREALPLISYRVCYGYFPIKREGDVLDLQFAFTTSKQLSRLLAGSESVLVFAATLGLPLDRLIARCGHTSPAKALCLQGLGAERIEALCDAFAADAQKEAEKNGRSLTPRFSPGYGDLPLTLQTDIHAALSCHRHIGLSLTDSLMMTPTKSVTALMGVKKQEI